MTTPTSDFTYLWNDALKKYREIASVDLLDDELTEVIEPCESADGVIKAIETEMDKFTEFRKGKEKWEKMRHVLKRVVHIVLLFNEAVAEVVTPVLVLFTSAIHSHSNQSKPEYSWRKGDYCRHRHSSCGTQYW